MLAVRYFSRQPITKNPVESHTSLWSQNLNYTSRVGDRAYVISVFDSLSALGQIWPASVLDLFGSRFQDEHQVTKDRKAGGLTSLHSTSCQTSPSTLPASPDFTILVCHHSRCSLACWLAACTTLATNQIPPDTFRSRFNARRSRSFADKSRSTPVAGKRALQYRRGDGVGFHCPC